MELVQHESGAPMRAGSWGSFRRKATLSLLVACGLVAAGGTPAAHASGDTHRYYRFVIDSVAPNTDGLSSVNELRLKIGGVWLENSNGTLGSQTHGEVRFGPAVGTSYTATVDVPANGQDLGLLFNGLNDVSWVAGIGYSPRPFGGVAGDVTPADAITAVFDFGLAPVALEGMRVFGDPWANGGAAGAEAPDRFRIQYSDNGTDWTTVFQTDEDVVTHDGEGYDALIVFLFLPPTGAAPHALLVASGVFLVVGIVLSGFHRRPLGA